MRTKEGSADYRYFSDPDLPNMIIDEEFINNSKKKIQNLPADKRKTLKELHLYQIQTI